MSFCTMMKTLSRKNTKAAMIQNTTSLKYHKKIQEIKDSSKAAVTTHHKVQTNTGHSE